MYFWQESMQLCVILSFQVGILYDKTEMGRDLTLKYISDNLCPPKVIAGLIF